MNRSGSPAERNVAALLVGLGYLLASRRHFGGAGDLLALARYETEPGVVLHRPLLIEVKATAAIPWQAGSDHFGPARRRELIDAADRWDIEPMLAWVPPGMPYGEAGGVFWIPADEWPSA